MQGDQTTDVSKTNPAFPYIINFCNLTQVRNNTGYVRSIRRVQQAPYPLIKVQPEELQSVVAGILIAIWWKCLFLTRPNFCSSYFAVFSLVVLAVTKIIWCYW
jgi:hypothetical protein